MNRFICSKRKVFRLQALCHGSVPAINHHDQRTARAWGEVEGVQIMSMKCYWSIIFPRCREGERSWEWGYKLRSVDINERVYWVLWHNGISKPRSRFKYGSRYMVGRTVSLEDGRDTTWGVASEIGWIHQRPFKHSFVFIEFCSAVEIVHDQAVCLYPSFLADQFLITHFNRPSTSTPCTISQPLLRHLPRVSRSTSWLRMVALEEPGV